MKSINAQNIRSRRAFFKGLLQVLQWALGYTCHSELHAAIRSLILLG
jgi:hypothetical protein